MNKPYWLDTLFALDSMRGAGSTTANRAAARATNGIFLVADYNQSDPRNRREVSLHSANNLRGQAPGPVFTDPQVLSVIAADVARLVEEHNQLVAEYERYRNTTARQVAALASDRDYACDRAVRLASKLRAIQKVLGE